MSAASVLYAQGVVYEEIKIDSNLIARFPGKVSSIKTADRDIYESDSDDIAFRIIKIHSSVIDKSKSGFDSSLLTFKRVTSRSMPYKFKLQSVDTIIGGTKGIFIKLYDPEIKSGFQKLYVFYTTRDSFTYSIYSNVKMDSEDTENKVKWFYSNLKFTTNYYETLPDYSFTPTQFWGKILAYVLVLFVLAYLMGSFFKKKAGEQ